MQLPRHLTIDAAATALDALRDAAAGGGALRIDASTLEVFDSSALALLLQARRMAQARGQPLQVHGAPPKLMQLAQLYGVAELLELTV